MENKKLKYPTRFYYLKASSVNEVNGHKEESWQVVESKEPFAWYEEKSTFDPVDENEEVLSKSEEVPEKKKHHHDKNDPNETVSDFLEDNKDKEVVVSVRGLTKDYGKGRGIFDVSFDVYKGTVFGYCGTNGSGKTTTLRHIMGFLKPDKGTVTVNGLDAWKDAAEIKKFVGYCPGEIAFPEVESGSAFLKIQAESVGLTDMSKAEQIINGLQLDPTANLRRMSKGMKQKTALVAAFMHSPDIIILDEPTTGLDPLMRDVFVNIIKAEKARGATIIMSNHMFDELEETCDYVAFIKDGHVIDIVDMHKMRNMPYRDYVIKFNNKKDYEEFDVSKAEVLEKDEDDLSITFRIELKKTNELINEFLNRDIKSLSEKKHTLEEFFIQDIGGQNND